MESVTEIEKGSRSVSFRFDLEEMVKNDLGQMPLFKEIFDPTMVTFHNIRRTLRAVDRLFDSLGTWP